MRAMGILAATGGVSIEYRPTAVSSIVNGDNSRTHANVPCGDPFNGRLLVVCVACSQGADRGFDFDGTSVGGEVLAVRTPTSAARTHAGIWLIENDEASTINVSLTAQNIPASGVASTNVAVYALKGAKPTPFDTAQGRFNSPNSTVSAPVNTRGGGCVIGVGLMQAAVLGEVQWTGLTEDVAPRVASAEKVLAEMPRAVDTTYIYDSTGMPGDVTAASLAVASFA